MTNKRSLTSSIARLSERTSLTIKMVLVTVVIGLSLWALLDYVQSSKLKKIFYVQLVEELTEQSRDDRIHFDRNINFYHRSVKLFIKQQNLVDHVEKQRWTKGEQIQIKYYKQTPPWFPSPSVLRIFAHPRFAMLMDSEGMVREVYQSRHDTSPPPSLLQPSNLLLLKSHEQSFITSLYDSLYLIASDYYRDIHGGKKAALMIATPIDDEFLLSASSSFTPGHLVALVTWEANPRILASSNQVDLPPGTPLSTLQNSYIITGQQTYDYGSAEYLIKLVSFTSMSEVDALTSKVIETGRQQRNIIAPVFILTFAFIMSWVARRITGLNKRMSDFSQQTLGLQKQELQSGDQLKLLEKRFQLLTGEILEARELLKKQAEEKTRLIVNNAFDAIVTMDTDGVIMTWNPQAEAIFGWTHEEATGQKVSRTIIPPKYREIYEHGLKNFLATGEGPIFNKQIQITSLHRDGHEFPIELSVSPAQSEGNYFFIAIIRDITARKKAEKQIKASLREKELLLRELHHRSKNNMQVISSLLNLQSKFVKDKHSVAMFNESKNRIKSMALVHEKLYRSKDLANIDFKDYINSLADGLFTFYRENTGKISLSVDADSVFLGIDTAIPCGLIINELLSNSFKHAFPKGRKGEIEVSLKKSDDEYELKVSDNGIGITENLDIRETKTLGLQLVTNLMEHQLQGSLKLDRKNGTEFQMRFKELRYKKRV
jgi:PAS domain S-box-containing protein